MYCAFSQCFCARSVVGRLLCLTDATLMLPSYRLSPALISLAAAWRLRTRLDLPKGRERFPGYGLAFQHGLQPYRCTVQASHTTPACCSNPERSKHASPSMFCQLGARECSDLPEHLPAMVFACAHPGQSRHADTRCFGTKLEWISTNRADYAPGGPRLPAGEGHPTGAGCVRCVVPEGDGDRGLLSMVERRAWTQ